MYECIDHKYLENIKCNPKNNKLKRKRSSTLLLQFVYTLNNLFLYAKQEFTNYEFALWIKHNEFYLERKTQYFSDSYKKRDIIWVDFGSNIGSELSYEHPCVVLTSDYQNIFVVPCSSSKLKKAYIKGTQETYPEYIIGDISDGFTKRTVMILNNAKWVSKARVIRKSNQQISQQLYNIIYEKLFLILFESKSYSINKLKSQNDELTFNNEMIEKENKRLREENGIMKSLVNTIDKKEKTG